MGTSVGRPQLAWLTLPSNEDDGATVAVTLDPDTVGDQALGSVIEVETQDLDVSRTAPAVLQLRYDSTLLEQDGVVRTWRDLEVMHQPSDGSYHRVVPCTKGGAIPRDEVACVDRRGKPESSRPVDGGVMMVVLTIETSRWRVP